MIGYSTTKESLETAIEAYVPGWLAQAKSRTSGFRRKKKYAEKSSIWSKVKPVYMRLQGESKCAYCERKLAAEEYGKGEQDVEHFRPKKNVKAWPLATSLVGKGIKLTRPSGRGGYYLLPYHIFNYAASCKPCNSALKGDRFPIAGAYKLSATDPAALRSEKAYLIYPIGDIDNPESLITFNGLSPSAIAQGGFDHQRALVTIEFFKLDDSSGRKDLYIGRAMVIIAMHPQLVAMTNGTPAQREAAKKLVQGFMSRKSPHANCARSFKRTYESNPDAANALFLATADYFATNS